MVIENFLRELCELSRILRIRIRCSFEAYNCILMFFIIILDFYIYFRNSTLAGYITHVLDALTTIEVPVDPAIKKSLELQ